MIALFVTGALISGYTIRGGVGPFDEGFILQVARRVADGQLPYRDFLWPYGPAHPYLLAGSFKAFGVSLIWWRILRVAIDAAVGVLVWRLVRPRAPAWLAGLAWLGAVAGMSQPSDPNPFAPALLLGLAGIACAAEGRSSRSAVWAGVLTGVAAAWRLDFGLYAFAGVAAALAFRERRRLLPAAGACAGVTALVYLPFVIAIGPADAWHQIVGRSLGEGGAWRLPFPLSYDGSLSLWPPGDAASSLKDVLDYYVPLLLVLGLAVAALRRRRPEPLVAGLLAFGACCFLYLLSRTDEFHAIPLLVVMCALLALSARERLGPVALAVLCLIAAYGTANRLSALFSPPALAALHLPPADGARTEPANARALERTVAEVKRLVPPGEPIYTVTLRSDLVRINDPMLYVLADRPNPLHEDIGLHARRADQHVITTGLARARPKAIIRWTDPESARREPNSRGEPSGSTELDDFLAREYRKAARYGYYEVLVPR